MPLHFKLDDLNENLRKQALDQLAPRKKPQPSLAPEPKNETPNHKPQNSTKCCCVKEPVLPSVSMEDYNPQSVKKAPIKEFSGEPNKTESDYNKQILNSLGRYEAVTLRLPGGNYTPDWMTIDDGVVTFHEVKGSFRFGSESRAVLGFRTAAAMFPFFRFVWAQKQKGGKWEVKRAIPAEPLE